MRCLFTLKQCQHSWHADHGYQPPAHRPARRHHRHPCTFLARLGALASPPPEPRCLHYFPRSRPRYTGASLPSLCSHGPGRGTRGPRCLRSVPMGPAAVHGGPTWRHAHGRELLEVLPARKPDGGSPEDTAGEHGVEMAQKAVWMASLVLRQSQTKSESQSRATLHRTMAHTFATAPPDQGRHPRAALTPHLCHRSARLRSARAAQRFTPHLCHRFARRRSARAAQRFTPHLCHRSATFAPLVGPSEPTDPMGLSGAAVPSGAQGNKSSPM